MNRMCVVCHRTSVVFESKAMLCLLFAILPLDTEITGTYPVSSMHSWAQPSLVTKSSNWEWTETPGHGQFWPVDESLYAEASGMDQGPWVVVASLKVVVSLNEQQGKKVNSRTSSNTYIHRIGISPASETSLLMYLTWLKSASRFKRQWRGGNVHKFT